MPIEQLTLFPTDSHDESPGRADSSATAPTNERKTMDDEFVLEDDLTTEEEMTAIASTIGQEFEKAMDKRADMATYNWLMRYGVPKTPIEVRYLISNIPPVMFVWAAKHGYITFNPTAIATEEEQARFAAEQVESAFEELDGGEVIQGRFGQYL